MTDRPLDNMDRLLQEKLHVYKEYLTATMLLKEALQNEEMVKVKQLITEREKLAGKVDRLQQQAIHPGRQAMNFPPHRVNQSRQSKTSTEIEEIINYIITANKDCETLAVSRCADLENGLLLLRQREAALSGYTAKPRRRPVFLSLKT